MVTAKSASKYVNETAAKVEEHMNKLETLQNLRDKGIPHDPNDYAFSDEEGSSYKQQFEASDFDKENFEKSFDDQAASITANMSMLELERDGMTDT